MSRAPRRLFRFIIAIVPSTKLPETSPAIVRTSGAAGGAILILAIMITIIIIVITLTMLIISILLIEVASRPWGFEVSHAYLRSISIVY